MENETIKNIIQQEFVKRCRNNESYSLRAFARSLGVDQSLLSKILRGKRAITQKLALTICSTLGIESEKVKQVFNEEQGSELNYKMIAEDIFAMISDWYHYAILELIKIKDFSSNVKWIANTLSITPSEVQIAIERLERLEFISIINEQVKLKSPDNSWIVNKDTTIARKLLQKQLLRKAIRAIDEIPFEKRDNSSLTIAINDELLPKIKEKIKKTRREIDQMATNQSNKPNKVYQICFAAYPLTTGDLE